MRERARGLAAAAEGGLQQPNARLTEEVISKGGIAN
jgi:hypothetical protein